MEEEVEAWAKAHLLEEDLYADLSGMEDLVLNLKVGDIAKFVQNLNIADVEHFLMNLGEKVVPVMLKALNETLYEEDV